MSPTPMAYRLEFPAMGSLAEVTAYCERKPLWKRAGKALLAEARRIEAKYSRYRDDSVTTRINRAAGGGPVAIDAETAGLLAYADACHRTSGGLFDLTSGELRRAWDFKQARLPDQSAVESLLPLVGWKKVERSDTACRLSLPGMELDFGGVGKEYAADRLAGIAASHGLQHALINLGGDIRAVGPRIDASPWRIGIPHPRRPGEVCAELALERGAIATSGDYERYIEADGRRYCHLLDPRTGWPVEGLASVSVLAPVCMVAGSLTTIAMLMGTAGTDFLRGQNVPAFVVQADGSSVRIDPAAANATAGAA
jgi:thiamine biosynthesis lipoprotein